MEYRDIYNHWRTNSYFDEETRRELNNLSEAEIEDRFYKDLEFGTAGLRGKIGAGRNRMNMYIVSRATQGLADYIVEKGETYMQRGVAIAYDCRHFSKEFAYKAASVLAANNIKVYLFDSLRPTPVLSFAVRYFNAASGIVVTASHNPKEYNGYKVYWEDGAQILEEHAEGITNKILNIEDFKSVKTITESEAIEKGLLTIIDEDLDNQYVKKVKALALRDDIDKDVKVVYTPLNGTGNVLVRRVLRERGFNNINVVKEQELPDPDFTTVPFPNPEDVRAFKLAEKLGQEIKADILIATDPDCDRLALMARDSEGYFQSFNGNQTGALLIKYIIETRNELKTLPKNSAIVKSIVTGDLGKVIAEKYGVKTFETLTGFKNICGKVDEFEKNKDYEFIFGYEESIGYVTGTFVRDKDAVIAAMMLCEAAAFYKKQGKNLCSVLQDIYKEYGYYKEDLISLVLEGIEGSKRIKRMMEVYRKDYPINVAGKNLVQYTDYKSGEQIDLRTGQSVKIDIPESNVLKFLFEDGSWYSLRPSGTEPKIKLYMYSNALTEEKSKDKLSTMKREVLAKLESIN